MQKNCQAHKLNKEDAMDHSGWRKFDDEDECEWVNVSSDTGLPG